MYHSVTFGSMNTFSDWHLVPEGRPVIAMPKPKKITVDIPGRNGLLDLTESIRKFPVFNNREGTLKFHVLNGYEEWEVKYSKIANYLHGKEMTVVLEDDPGWYYTGRVEVNSWTSNNNGTWSDIEFGYSLQPYKLSESTTTTDAWKWDPFSFVDGIIVGTQFKEIMLGSSTSWTTFDMKDFIGSMPISPTIIVNDTNRGIDVRFTNEELGLNITKTDLRTGTYTWPEVILTNMSNNNDVKIELKKSAADGHADSVSIDYRWGSL